MATVHLALDRKHGRLVALKVLRPVGYAHREWIEHDMDLDALHADPRWRALIGRFGGPTRE